MWWIVFVLGEDETSGQLFETSFQCQAEKDMHSGKTIATNFTDIALDRPDAYLRAREYCNGHNWKFIDYDGPFWASPFSFLQKKPRWHRNPPPGVSYEKWSKRIRQ